MPAERKTRRTGSERSETRKKLLDTTARVMVEDGYAAVTSRRIAKEAEVTPGLVHYYFPTLDELFLALLSRAADHNLALQARLLASDQPLRALWRFSREWAGAALLREFVALANHRKPIRSEIVRYTELFRRTQLESLGERLGRYDLVGSEVSPEALLVLMTGVSQHLEQERALGIDLGARDVEALVERMLTRLEGPARDGSEEGPSDGRGGSASTISARRAPSRRDQASR